MIKISTSLFAALLLAVGAGTSPTLAQMSQFPAPAPAPTATTPPPQVVQVPSCTSVVDDTTREFNYQLREFHNTRLSNDQDNRNGAETLMPVLESSRALCQAGRNNESIANADLVRRWLGQREVSTQIAVLPSQTSVEPPPY